MQTEYHYRSSRQIGADRELFVAVAGNIGAGKSSLTRYLADTFNWHPFFEANAENPYLADFYGDMERWSFHSQVFFMGKRLEHHRQLIEHPGSVVQDRTVYEDAEIFACNLYRQGNMGQRDYETYRRLYEAVSAFVPPPDLIIYLKANTETLMSHINKRGRDYEKNIDPAYISQLNDLYNAWAEDWTASPLLTIELDNIDFVGNNTHRQDLLARVQAQLPR